MRLVSRKLKYVEDRTLFSEFLIEILAKYLRSAPIVNIYLLPQLLGWLVYSAFRKSIKVR